MTPIEIAAVLGAIAAIGTLIVAIARFAYDVGKDNRDN